MTVGTNAGTWALHVAGRSFCRLWGDRERRRDGKVEGDVLVVFCDPDEKDLLLETWAPTLFSTPHYHGYPALCVRLADVDERLLAELLEDSYRAKAPARLRAQLDG